MARKPQRPSVQQEVMQSITRLMQRKPTPDRARIEAENIFADLRQRGDANEVRNWLEEMRDGFAEAAEAVDEVEPSKKAERAQAENVAVCLREVGKAFGRALEEPAPA